MTRQETMKALKADIDTAITEIIARYQEELKRYSTVQNVLDTEWIYAIYELRKFGKILDNSERWHSEHREHTEEVYERYVKDRF